MNEQEEPLYTVEVDVIEVIPEVVMNAIERWTTKRDSANSTPEQREEADFWLAKFKGEYAVTK